MMYVQSSPALTEFPSDWKSIGRKLELHRNKYVINWTYDSPTWFQHLVTPVIDLSHDQGESMYHKFYWNDLKNIFSFNGFIDVSNIAKPAAVIYFLNNMF